MQWFLLHYAVTIHTAHDRAHAICSYGVINVGVQATIRPRTSQCLRGCHHHLFPRPESIFDKRQLRSEAIRCGMDVYAERVIKADSHETWHWWVDHVRPTSIHWMWELTVTVDKQSDVMNPVLSHLSVITQKIKYFTYICADTLYGVTAIRYCILTLILPRSRTGTVWFYTSTSNKRAARPKL